MQNVGRYADILFRAVYNQEKEMVVSQMGEEFIKYSRDVFMMHDIGRHYIPVSILNKVEKLTEEEIQIIKNHTVDVAKAIDSVYEQPYPESVMEQLLQISLYHHERYDGGGYPLGLKGEEIALGARICAIADTYDGITAWKPYKRKQTTKADVLELVRNFTKTLLEYNEGIQIKAAFGIYKITDITMPVMDMINQANLAQKFVKESDDNNYQFFTDELNQRFLENKRMSEEMEKALEDHKFVMFLQPMVDLHSYKIVSAEALVRWDYPGKGMLSPYAFLPLFEGTSLIQKLDYYMWEECCKTVRRWIDNKMEPVPITMNISPAHFQSHKFIDYLLELMDKYLIQKKWIVLELPERGLTNISEQVGSIIKRLHEEGFQLCIDNFGSISSPLNLLKDFPIQRIKLDRSFLARNATSGEGLEIIRCLIAMAKELDFTVITEGIETAEQVKFLVEIGCDIGQGYYFSKPVDIRAFDQLNRTMVTTLYRPDEYYPTFEDYERYIDLIVQMFSEVARYENFFKEENSGT